MCELVFWFEKLLSYSAEQGNKQAKLLRMAGRCSGLRILIILAYRDDAGEILREIRKELEKRVR